MAKTTRRQLLKGSAGGAVTLVALSAGAGSARAQGRHGLHVHIHGVLSGVGFDFTVAVSIDVAGSPDDLAGAGWDSGTQGTAGMVPSPGPTPTSGPVGACYYTAAGSIVGDTVTLKGRSLFTNRPLALADSEEPGRSDTRADGREVNIVANADTGEIFWQLGTAAFTGMGLVMVTHASRTSR